MNKQLSTNVNKYLADIAVMYVKIHNLHWNVVGQQFKGVHEMLEGLYENFGEALDDVAEVLKMHNEMPLASMRSYLAVTKIHEIDEKEFTIAETLSTVLADLETMQATALALRKEGEEADCFSVVNLLEDHLENYHKNLWFLRATLK